MLNIPFFRTVSVQRIFYYRTEFFNNAYACLLFAYCSTTRIQKTCVCVFYVISSEKPHWGLGNGMYVLRSEMPLALILTSSRQFFPQ
jgi:hypothetical protein